MMGNTKSRDRKKKHQASNEEQHLKVKKEPFKLPNASGFYPSEFRQLNKLCIRDAQIHLICIDEKSFDDELLLRQHDCFNYKISAVRVAIDYNKYVTGIQARYLNLDTGKQIEGFGPFVDSTAKWFELEKGQYLISVVGRLGMIIDQLGFRTNTGRVYHVGGEGGSQFERPLPIGYHIGALSCTKKSFLQGIQFDYKCIKPTNKEVKEESFGFFDSVVNFEYLIEYLSVRDIMRLFLVSTQVAEFRKSSEKFWIKCLTLYDRVVISYLKGLASAYNIEQLDLYLQKYYAVTDLKFRNANFAGKQNFNASLDTQQLSKELVPGKSYLIVVGIQFKNSVFDFGDCHYHMLFEGQKLFESKFLKESETHKGKIAPLHTRKFAIFFEWNQETREVLDKVSVQAIIQSSWYDAYYAEIVYKYAIHLQCGITDLVGNYFTKLANGVLVNHQNTRYMKFDTS